MSKHAPCFERSNRRADILNFSNDHRKLKAEQSRNGTAQIFQQTSKPVPLNPEQPDCGMSGGKPNDPRE